MKAIRIFIFSLSLLLAFSSYAVRPMLKLSNDGIVLYPVNTFEPGDKLTYTFTLTNQLPFSVYLEKNRAVLSNPLCTNKLDINDNLKTDCPFGSKTKPLDSFKSCEITSSIIAPSVKNALSCDFLYQLRITDGLGFTSSYQPLGITLLPTDKKGHLTLLNKDKKVINNLVLKSGDKGSLTLKNTGKGTIYNLDLESGVKNLLTGECYSLKRLIPNAECSIDYHFGENVSMPDEAFQFIARGSNSENKASIGIQATNEVYAYAYISEQNPNSVRVCKVARDGSLSNCLTSEITRSFLDGPHAIKFLKNDIYLGDVSKLARCNVDVNNGVISSCANLTNENISASSAITEMHFNEIKNKIYLSYSLNGHPNFKPETIICDLNDQGISGCNKMSPVSSEGKNIDFYVRAINQTKQKVYLRGQIVDSTTNAGVLVCDIDTSGTFSNCIKTATSITAAIGPMVINSTKDKAYIAEESAQVEVCDIKPDNLIDNCKTTTVDGVKYLGDIWISPDEKHAYITDYNYTNKKIYLCDINESRAFVNCETTAGGYDSPKGIIIIPKP